MSAAHQHRPINEADAEGLGGVGHQLEDVGVCASVDVVQRLQNAERVLTLPLQDHPGPVAEKLADYCRVGVVGGGEVFAERGSEDGPEAGSEDGVRVGAVLEEELDDGGLSWERKGWWLVEFRPRWFYIQNTDNKKYQNIGVLLKIDLIQLSYILTSFINW